MSILVYDEKWICGRLRFFDRDSPIGKSASLYAIRTNAGVFDLVRNRLFARGQFESDAFDPVLFPKFGNVINNIKKTFVIPDVFVGADITLFYYGMSVQSDGGWGIACGERSAEVNAALGVYPYDTKFPVFQRRRSDGSNSGSLSRVSPLISPAVSRP